MPQNDGCPILEPVCWVQGWDTTKVCIEIRCFPPLPEKRRQGPRISYCAAPATAACAAFYKESRMKFVDPPSLTGNPGGWGTRRLVALSVSDIKHGLVATAAAAGERMTGECKAQKPVF